MKTLTQSIPETSVTLLAFAWILLSIVVTACGGTQDRNKAKVTPASCGGCADLWISVDKRFYTQGEPVTVTTMISVHDDTRLGASDWCDILSNYEIDLINEQGQAVSWTGVGGAGAGCRFFAEISRNHPFTESFQLNQYFRLSEPGTYTLTMQKYVWISGTERSFALTAGPVVFARLP